MTKIFFFFNNYRPSGILDNIVLDFSGSLQPKRPISVIITVGFTLLILMPCLPSSRAEDLVKPSRAALELQ